ncbi:hypothetical protein NC652_009369 [Populus alba x Populus x berolinensis]|uniref:Uncharacterized protein n=1 Tax=Populus alba x Populus x berolinensis TaxID=444605 RepID=A0AAD6W9L4_9ROSI|nr:hypothetical protein NC651_009155 [Populus alba x Populus x berolinensis]KAJ6943903.1 hypothetical protein NC652_009361 [Populus alba x Populus x berolinensis]KAJ6943912.1 hypothetical protein NC652_009369 [Populus alba x Populus x berolinensis]KAJ7004490.1 hypothetical protein NC653_009367 [Populus alba x Populus x berolinensis]
MIMFCVDICSLIHSSTKLVLLHLRLQAKPKTYFILQIKCSCMTKSKHHPHIKLVLTWKISRSPLFKG